MASHKDLVNALLAHHGQTFAAEIGIHAEKNTPAPLFQLLVMALLFSARIPHRNAITAVRALLDAKLTTPRAMAAATWQERVDVLTAHGYKRYDESGSRMLGDTATLLLDRYRGDLRRLREEAGRDVAREHALLQRFKGIGPVGADIFLREVQLVWDEAYPYADRRVLDAAEKLGLGADARALARHVSRTDFPRFVAAIVRVDLSGAYDEVRATAA